MRRWTRTVLKHSTSYTLINDWVSHVFHFDNQIRPRGNPRRKKKNQRIYKDCMAAFDIETTNYAAVKQAFIYLWSFTIENKTIVGRTFEQFVYLMKMLSAEMADSEYLVVYVHNLSFEWNWIKSLGPDISDVFAMDTRQIVKCTLFDHIEMRCSYILTNSSLALFTKNMNVKHKKLNGAKFDYDKIRTPGRAVKKYELEYSISDTRGLVEALKVFYSIENDNHYTITMTSTGFVRRDMVHAIRSGVRYSYMKKWQLWENDHVTPSLNLLMVMHDSFRGGDCHACRFRAGKVIKGKKSRDRDSSYIAELINKPYPYSFHHMGPVSIKKFKEMVNGLGMAALVVIKCTGIELLDPFEADPYLSYSKLHYVKNDICDNGRVLSCDSCIMSVNDVDLRIILSSYRIKKIEILDSWFATYKPLPQVIKDVIIEYYHRKTMLRGLPNQELNYQKAKNKLNATYGLTVYFPLKKSLKWTGKDFVYDDSLSDLELLRRYNNKGFIPYQVGCWVTSWARYELRRGMRIVGNENNLYQDTDSIKYIESSHVPDFTKYNKECKKLAIKNGSAAQDSKGIWHYPGQYTEEPDADYFITLGAKKYCEMDESGHVSLTLAGVGKRSGARELEKLGGIKMFKPGTVFKKSAGLKATYNDDPEIKEIRIGSETIPIISNLYLEPTEYTLSITPDYKEILYLALRIWNDAYDENEPEYVVEDIIEKDHL